MAQRLQAILFRLVPALLVVGLVAVVLRGPGGLWHFRELREQADVVKGEWAAVERENTVLLLRLQQLGHDPIHLERLAAEQLHYARPGATLYAFAEGGDVAAVAGSRP